MPVLVLIVFVSMLGNSVLAPLIPFYALRLGVTPEYITILAAVFSVFQFIGAPIWGRISDRVGRKPVLIGTVAGTALGFILLAFADSIWLLLLARIVGGFAAGNLSTAYAYVSDITTSETRAAGMGKVGAAFGFGFVVGPVISGFLAGGDSLVDANFVRPALASATLAIIALLGTIFFLKESKTPNPAARRVPAHPFAPMRAVLRNRNLAMVLILGVICFTAVAQRETTVALWLHDFFGMSPRELGYVFAYVGLLITIFQGAALARLSRRIGDGRVLISGIVVYIVGLICLVVTDGIPLLIVGTTCNAYGTAVLSITLPTVASKLARPDERGLVMGAYQGAASFGRFLGPAFSGTIYAHVGHTAPFASGAAGLCIGLVLAVILQRRLRTAAES